MTRLPGNDPAWLDHFWKVFAVACVALGAGFLYLGNTAIAEWHATWNVAVTDSTAGYKALNWANLLRDTERQAKPATVIFKNAGPAVTGYFTKSDGDFVILATVFKDEAREERVFIPVESIQYVKVNLSLSGEKK